jgi:hypothetical protein
VRAAGGEEEGRQPEEFWRAAGDGEIALAVLQAVPYFRRETVAPINLTTNKI